jgi:hypothetical protein
MMMHLTFPKLIRIRAEKCVGVQNVVFPTYLSVARWSRAMLFLIIILTKTSPPSIPKKHTAIMYVSKLNRWDLTGQDSK